MKILIVAQARSGSTSLLKAISKAICCDIIYEPFMHGNKYIDDPIKKINDTEDIVVKVVDNYFYTQEEYKNAENFFSLFDKVIGLTRDSSDENVISFLVAEDNNSWRKSSKDKINNETINKIKNSKRYKERLMYSEKIKKEIKSFDIFQVTYEGLYKEKNDINTIQDYLGFEIEAYIEPEGDLVIPNKKNLY